MTTGFEGLVVERPGPDCVDGWFALDALQRTWLVVKSVELVKPERMGVAVKVALSWKLWSEMSKLKFKDGMGPVDRPNSTLFGVPVEPQDWPFERIELVLPVEVKARDRV